MFVSMSASLTPPFCFVLSNVLCSMKQLESPVISVPTKYCSPTSLYIYTNTLSLKIYTKKTLQEKNLVKPYTLLDHVEVSPSKGSADSKGLYKCNERGNLTLIMSPNIQLLYTHRVSLDSWGAESPGHAVSRQKTQITSCLRCCLDRNMHTHVHILP